MTTTWPLDIPGFRKATDKVAPKPAIKTATAVPKTATAKPNDFANTILAADAAAAISIISGKRITTDEVLLKRSLPLEKPVRRRGKI